jgi:uncharacterized repeat protein (TIGR03803 family)
MNMTRAKREISYDVRPGATLVSGWWRGIGLVCLVAAATAVAARAQTYTVLYTFTGGAEGGNPAAGLLLDAAGNLYGTATFGGTGVFFGVVFKLHKEVETVLHSFAGYPTDGSDPSYAGLVRDDDGNLYGTTRFGGTYDNGTVFKVDRGGKETVLYSFTGNADGANPTAGLVLGKAGNLYGTTSSGGDLSCGGGCGVVFKLDRTGTETVLHAFTGGADGANPFAGLVRDQAGNFYGSTINGGAPCGYCGVVFKLDPTGAETVLYAFTGLADGLVPSDVVLDGAGNLYGTTTFAGDACFCGVVFKLDPTGNQTVLYSFTGGTDGGFPVAGLIRDTAGNLYGTTLGGGDPICGCGVVFKVDPAGNETVLYTFTGGADGASPYADLVQDRAGNLYGTATNGGDLSCGCGVVFKLTQLTLPPASEP